MVWRMGPLSEDGGVMLSDAMRDIAPSPVAPAAGKGALGTGRCRAGRGAIGLRAVNHRFFPSRREATSKPGAGGGYARASA